MCVGGKGRVLLAVEDVYVWWGGSCWLWEMVRDQKQAAVEWDGPAQSSSSSESSSEVLSAHEPGDDQEVHKITQAALRYSSGFSSFGETPGG